MNNNIIESFVLPRPNLFLSLLEEDGISVHIFLGRVTIMLINLLL